MSRTRHPGPSGPRLGSPARRARRRRGGRLARGGEQRASLSPRAAAAVAGSVGRGRAAAAAAGALMAGGAGRVPVVPVVAGGRCGRGRAQQVVEDVDDGADVALGPAVPVLQGRVQGAAERARVDALAVVVHRLDYRSLSALRVLLGVHRQRR